MSRNFLHAACALPALAFVACSNFDSRFARESAAHRKGDPFSGTYQGRWTSSSHPGNGGKLWCILSRRRDSGYLAEFRATWHGIFSSRHLVVLHAKQGRSWSSGPPVLGFAGTSAIRMFVGSGTYECEGRTDGRRMQASYDATYDRGTFDLVRVRLSPPDR